LKYWISSFICSGGHKTECAFVAFFDHHNHMLTYGKKVMKGHTTSPAICTFISDWIEKILLLTDAAVIWWILNFSSYLLSFCRKLLAACFDIVASKTGRDSERGGREGADCQESTAAAQPR